MNKGESGRSMNTATGHNSQFYFYIPRLFLSEVVKNENHGAVYVSSIAQRLSGLLRLNRGEIRVISVLLVRSGFFILSPNGGIKITDAGRDFLKSGAYFSNETNGAQCAEVPA